ncbi:MAG TPA: hypothetical protein VFO12_04005 [Sphingomicrobium sp.]|nr:hypothetical protein [Sphingomicrobium sp.]
MTQMRELYGSSMAHQFAVIHAQLDDRDRAFAALDDALALRDPGLVGLKTDVFLDPVRDDPRYAALVRTLRFP